MDDLTIKIGVKADSKDARLLLDKLLDTIKTPFAWFEVDPFVKTKFELF